MLDYGNINLHLTSRFKHSEMVWKFIHFRFKVHLETYRPGEILPAKEYGKLMKEMDAFPPGMVIEDDKSGKKMIRMK